MRTIPLPPKLANALRKLKLECPKGPLDLVFPNGVGQVESHANIINRGLLRMIAADVADRVKDAEGKIVVNDKPVMRARYTGLHALRHFYAGWCINRKVDGGLELPAKVVQTRLGHALIVMTLDTYGHLFPRGDDAAELAAAETALLG